MPFVAPSLAQVWSDDRAQDLVEYALLIGFLSVAAAAVLPGPAMELSIIFSKMVSLTDRAGGQTS